MSKIAIGVILLCASGIGLIINETVKENDRLNILTCSDRGAILAEKGPIRQTPEGVYWSRSGKSYVPMPGSVCSVESFEL